MLIHLVLALLFVGAGPASAQEVVAPIPCHDEGTTVEFHPAGVTAQVASVIDHWKIRFLDFGTANGMGPPNGPMGEVDLSVPEVLNPPDPKTGGVESVESQKRQFLLRQGGQWYNGGWTGSALGATYSETLQSTRWDWKNKKLVTEDELKLEADSKNPGTIQIASTDGRVVVVLSGLMYSTPPPQTGPNGQTTFFPKKGMISLTVTRNQILEGTLHYRVGTITPIGPLPSELGILEARHYTLDIPTPFGGPERSIVFNRTDNCEAPAVPVAFLLNKAK